MRKLLLVAMCALSVACGDDSAPQSAQEMAPGPVADAGAVVEQDGGEPAVDPPRTDAATVQADSAVTGPQDAQPDGDASTTQAVDADTDEPNPLYSELWSKVFYAKCVDCHAGFSPSHGYAPILDNRYAAPATALGIASHCMDIPYMTPGDPSQSMLYLAFTAEAPCGEHAPIKKPMTTAEVELIKAFINGEDSRRTGGW